MGISLTDPAAVLAVTEPSPLMPETGELVVGLIAFVLLFLFLKAKVFPLFEKVFAERTAAIQGGIEKAEKAQAEAAAALEQYNAQLAEARGEAGRIRTEAQSQRAEIVEEARAEARTEAQRILTAATTQIESERQQALTELRRDVGSLAVQLAGKLVGESLEDEARQRRTVERFLEGLEDVSGQGTTAPAGAAG